jgi:TfoX/Sxy family transcriptional regulator of competence genes
MTLEARLSQAVSAYPTTSQKMFGGVCYLVGGNMAICISKRGILARVGPEAAPALSHKPGAKPMEMRGKIVPGYLRLDESAVATEAALREWVSRCMAFATSLPPKPQSVPKSRVKTSRKP